MNLLEHYIEEIHSEEIKEENLVEVDMTTLCYGTTKREINVYPKDYWEEKKQKGYYMG